MDQVEVCKHVNKISASKLEIIKGTSSHVAAHNLITMVDRGLHYENMPIQIYIENFITKK